MLKKTTYYFVGIVLVLLFLHSCDSKPAKKEMLTHPQIIDSIVDSYVENGFYPMLYARVENKDGSVAYEHSAVNQELLPESTIDGDTWFRIWSMSKIITISLVLDLVEDGFLNLDDPVEKYIPEFGDLKVALTQNGESLANYVSQLYSENKPKDDPCPLQIVPNDSIMSVLNLINHKGGFYYATTNVQCLDDEIASLNLLNLQNSQELIDAMAQLPLMQHPGSTHFYGTNTTVLGLVAERATGKSLKELVEERITGPLKIEGLRYKTKEGITLFPQFSGKDSIIRVANQGELDILGEYIPNYSPENELYLGGEGMIGTANGYADFLRMLMNYGELNGHRFLNEDTVKEIYSPHTQLDNPDGYNGYNLWVSKESYKERGIGDAGLWIGGGYEATHFWVDPKREFVGVIMSQMYWIPEEGYTRDDRIRGGIYKQIFQTEKEK